MNTRKKIDRMYRKIDRLLQKGYFDKVDRILRLVDPTKMSIIMNLGLLTITLAVSEELADRRAYADAVRAHLTKIEPDKVDHLIMGLD